MRNIYDLLWDLIDWLSKKCIGWCLINMCIWLLSKNIEYIGYILYWHKCKSIISVSFNNTFLPHNIPFEVILDRKKNHLAAKISILFGYQIQLLSKISKYPNFFPVLLQKSILYDLSQPILIFWALFLFLALILYIVSWLNIGEIWRLKTILYKHFFSTVT